MVSEAKPYVFLRGDGKNTATSKNYKVGLLKPYKPVWKHT
jgi:hypothetical protein